MLGGAGNANGDIKVRGDNAPTMMSDHAVVRAGTSFGIEGHQRGPLSSPYHVEEPRFDLQDIQSESWVADILQHQARTKIAVLNSGPWWTPSPIFHASSNTSVPVQDLMAAYAHHFSPKGRLHALAATLRAHRVLLVWRDEMNQIGHRFVLQHGGVVLPHIWDASLPHSAEHVFGPNADALHWCNYRPWLLPWIWATVLYNELDALLAKAATP
eukprot:gene8239-5939_t